MSGPLSGIRVVEIAAVLSGPLGAMILADQGAHVVKVEALGLGDILRSPNFARGGLASFFLNCNRGKQSIVVDTSRPEGGKIVLDLMRTADVVIQNYRPGVVDRLGLGYADARAVNPDIIYASISGYGDSGPYRDRRVYDPIIQGLSGHVAAQVNPEMPLPDLVRNVVADKATAWAVAQSVTAALFARSQGAGGQHLTIPMLDVSLAFFWPDGMMAHTFLGSDQPPGRALYEIYRLTPTADGHLLYFVAGEKETHALLRALDRADLIEDPRFSTPSGRVAHVQELGEIIAGEFVKWPTDVIISRLAEAGVAVGPVLGFDEIFDDPQVVHNEVVVERDHPTAGRLREIVHPVRFAGTPTSLGDVAPLHGEHTDSVLAGLGYAAAEIASLRDAGVVA